jgi:hypothetical protein
VKVAELIEELKKMPQDAAVMHIWDGGARTEIEWVWLARNGKVMTIDSGMVVYDTDDRPKYAPTKEKEQYWESPGKT